MRQIKFRAWNSELKEIIPWYQMVDDHWSISDMSNCETLMQFTGLKDKNGKEIYEGDIVKIDEDVPIMFKINSIEAVHYINGSFHLNSVPIGFITNINYILRGEVIGNIYKTPELATPK